VRDSSNWKPTSYRTHTIGQVVEDGESLVGKEVTIAGYAETVRGRGAICFLMLRDGTGRVQAFLKRDNMDEGLFEAIQSATRESTIQVTGVVAQKRPPKVAEGEPTPPAEFEVSVGSGAILAEAETPLPVGVTDEVNVGLDVRLDNRHLDLRRSHVNAMFQLRSKVLQYGREHLITEGFQEINSPKIIAAAAEGGTNLFPMKYFETDAYLSQSPQLYKQLAVLGGLERVFEIGPAFRAEKHDTYRHLNEFVSFDIEGAWMDDEDVMGVQERMIHHIWGEIAKNDMSLIGVVNEYRESQGKEPVIVEAPELPFPRIPYCEAIEIVKSGGGEIQWGDDIESHHCDIIASQYPGFHFIPRWPMSMKPFYIHHKQGERSAESWVRSELRTGRDDQRRCEGTQGGSLGAESQGRGSGPGRFHILHRRIPIWCTPSRWVGARGC
jgi:aspartyl-tRNA synthetase